MLFIRVTLVALTVLGFSSLTPSVGLSLSLRCSSVGWTLETKVAFVIDKGYSSDHSLPLLIG